MSDLDLTQLDAVDRLFDGKVHGVPLNRIRAVLAVEAEGEGDLEPGVPKRLVEGHRAWKLCKAAGLDPARIAASGYGDVLYPKWTKAHYKGGYGEVRRMERLTEAVGEDIALQATSFGIGQVLGENYQVCGFDTVQDFYAAMCEGETRQAEVMVAFMEGRNLLRHLRGDEPRFDKFAEGYNGTGYRKNQYDSKMWREYRKLEESPQNDFKPVTASRRTKGAATIAVGEAVKQAAENPDTVQEWLMPVVELVNTSTETAETTKHLWESAAAMNALGWAIFAVGLGYILYSRYDDRKKGRT